MAISKFFCRSFVRPSRRSVRSDDLRSALTRIAWMAVACFASAGVAHGQWLSQSFTLKPGWNAVFTHVDASYTTLDAMVPDANGAVAEVWLWKPTFSTAQFINSPYSSSVPNSQWSVWTSARGDVDTLTRMVGNGAYLVNNRSSSDYVWTVKGRVVPPTYSWTTTGLNFIGFPTPSTSPNFSSYLTPAPGLDLSKTLQNGAHVFRYVGGALGASNPAEVVSVTASTTSVVRGQAYWVRGNTNYYNRYYGPVEVALQDPKGIDYRDTLGSYSLRLRNLTSSSRVVSLTMVASDADPAGSGTPPNLPQLLVRGALDPNTLTYGYAVLTNQQFTLPPQGQTGSDIQVILGLNRSLMTAASGTLYAGILRITDADGLQQFDVPVSGKVPSTSGLWVGKASINQVGQYLKSYPKVDTSQTDQTSQINAAASAAGRPANGYEFPGSAWVAREASSSRAYSAVATSLDGKVVVAAVSGGSLYTSQDYGVTWTSRDSSRSWAELACSADGSTMAATVFNGLVYVSTNYGTNWTATGGPSGAWVGLSISADGNTLAAVVQNGPLYLSTNRGGTWTSQSGAGTRNWSSVAMSADGSKLIAAVNPGYLYTSTDRGGTWKQGALSASWSSVASSADGVTLVAAISGGAIYVSTDSGMNWISRGSSGKWSSVASSTDGKRLAAAQAGGQIFTSSDSGVNWVATDTSRNWDDVVTSADGTRLVAVVNPGQIFTLNRKFASYAVDQASGLVQDQDGLYLSTGVNTNLAKVGNPYPLRLILQNQGSNSVVSLLQRVYVGVGINTSNTIVATRESLLDPSQLASARRITATHLPFSKTNALWSASGLFNPGNVLMFTVPLSYKDQASNPFLHTFHPDHDNLDANFKSVLARGVESYDLNRSIRITFSPPGTDFASLTAAAQTRSGTYEETMTVGAQGSASRDFRLSGTFSLQLISPVATLSTQ